MQILQDLSAVDGLVQFLFENDAAAGKIEVVPLGTTSEPTITADVWLVATAIAGPAGENLTGDLTLAIVGKPTVTWPGP
jgi:hypothetical protein